MSIPTITRKYPATVFFGLEAASRTRLAKVLRLTHGTVTPASAALADTRLGAAKQLSRWAGQGWTSFG